MASDNVGSEHDYSILKDLRFEFNAQNDDATFFLCFWLYLPDSTPSPSTILRQMHSEIACSVPFVALDENKKLMLFPLLFLHKESPVPYNSTSWVEVPHASARIAFSFAKWVHVGCEVAADLVRLHINGEIAGEMPLSSSSVNDSNSNGLRSISLAGDDGNDGFEGYVHSFEVLPKTSSIKAHFVKSPPLQLSVDGSSASEIEEDEEGVWSIVGGKASCRRNFSLDVTLQDAFGKPINKEMEVVASLLYADNGSPVEKPDDAEAPLLTSCDGIEFASCDRPSKLTNGRASFKLKIAQLSSKCDNRLFRIKFEIPKMGSFPFFEALFSPIRCISRNRSTHMSTVKWKRSNSNGLGEESSELLYNIAHEAKLSPSSKRVKLGQESTFATCKANLTMDRIDDECNSHALTANEDYNAYGSCLERGSENHEEKDYSLSDSESIEARNSNFKRASSNRSPVSDTAIFKYCLGGLNERALLLKEVATEASEKELADFAQQVSVYLGCSHHGRQVILAKRLVEEGTKAWDLISQNNPHVTWENVVAEINHRFMKIACSGSRSLTLQDFEILRRIAGCQEFVARENFEKMWCWLYPVAFSLSGVWVNAMWNSASPKWIEGFITKEDAESSLQGPGVLQNPGTFVLRFPTSRSWPHPDAGNLVATYVGSDYNIHHRLLALDFVFSSGEKEMSLKPLQDMLLAEPELSRLGRIIRSH